MQRKCSLRPSRFPAPGPRMLTPDLSSITPGHPCYRLAAERESSRFSSVAKRPGARDKNLKRRHHEADIGRYAGHTVLSEDIGHVDEIYLWFVGLKENLLRKSG